MGTAVIRVVRWSATSIYRAGIEGEVCFDLTLFLLGSDFLSTHGCGIDLNTRLLLAGGEMVGDFEFGHTCDCSLSTCMVAFKCSPLLEG